MAIFGCPGYIHTDRGSQLLSEEFDQFCLANGIAHSRTIPYNPSGNGQCERFHGSIFKTVRCILLSRNLPPKKRGSVLPESLSAIRLLLCSATNVSPHSRFFKFAWKSGVCCFLPSLLSSAKPAFLRNAVRNKDDPAVCPVAIYEVVNPFYAHVEVGRIDTVSTKNMSPSMECSKEKANESPAGEEGSEEMTSGNQEAETTLRDVAKLTPEKESNVTLCPSPQFENLNPESQ